ncbi:MAG: DUF4123 domain-containing protein [Candidatus Competibacteraceae bacterium]
MPDATVYMVLDGASTPDLPQTLARLGVESVCLYQGELAQIQAQMAPYLAVFEPNAPFAEWVLEEGWGKHWGTSLPSARRIFARCASTRTFLKVYGPDLKPLYLAITIHGCCVPICRPVIGRSCARYSVRSRYIVEDEDPVALLKFQPAGDQVKREQIVLA